MLRIERIDRCLSLSRLRANSSCSVYLRRDCLMESFERPQQHSFRRELAGCSARCSSLLITKSSPHSLSSPQVSVRSLKQTGQQLGSYSKDIELPDRQSRFIEREVHLPRAG